MNKNKRIRDKKRKKKKKKTSESNADTRVLDSHRTEYTQHDLSSATSETATSSETTDRRQVWTVDQYRDLMWSYYYATETGIEAPKTRGTY